MFNQRGIGTDAGTPAPYYYVGRYDSSLVGNKLQSATGKAPAVSLTIGQARTYAENKGTGWGITNIWTLSGLRQLFYTEMLTLNSQTAWTKSRGLVDFSWSGGHKNSGADSIDTQISANNATGSGTGENGYTPVSYRGIENLWGNVWQFQDGVNAIQGTTNVISPTGLGVTGKKTTFKDLMDATDVQSVGALVLNYGWQKNLMNTDVARPLFLPSAVGGSDTAYLSDRYYPPYSTNPGTPNILLSGGDWRDTGNAGVGILDVVNDASESHTEIGARLEFRRSTVDGAHAVSVNPTATSVNTGTVSTISKPTIQSTPTSVSNANNGFVNTSKKSDSNFVIDLLFTIFIIFGLCISGVYVNKRMKKKPSNDQPPVNEPVRQQPLPTAPSSGSEDLLNRFTTIEQQSGGLSCFRSIVKTQLTKAKENYLAGNYDAARSMLRETEGMISSLELYETRLTQWKQEGYETSTLESLKEQNNLDFIHSRFKDYEERLSRLEKIEISLRDLNRHYPVEFKNPEIQKKVELFSAQLKNPMQISDIDGQYELIKKNIEESSRVNVQRDQRIQSQIQLLRGSIEILMNMGIDTSTFFAKVKSQDSAHTENDLKEMAETVYSKINNEMNLLQKEGVVVTRSSDEIRALIDDKNYAKAIIASGKKMSGSSALRETYSKAVLLKNILEPSPVIALFNTGNYEQFLDEGDEIYDLVNQCTTLTAKAEPLGPLPENIPKKFMELRKEQLLNTISALKRFIQESEEIKRARLSARGLFEKAEAFGKIPESLLTNIDKLDKQQLERTITELEKYLKTAKPDLTFSIEKTQFVVNQWHKTKISITNKGNAHAHEINFIFSQEFETKWIEETDVKAQGSSEIEIGLLPKTEGNIPLEITAKYHDGHNKEYTSRNKFWIEVIDKMSKTPAPGPAPIKPKSPTQKQLPPELSDRYTKSEFIGEGGFARVFKAMRNDGKYVAVKIPLSMDAKTGKSFIAEMQNWTKLSHPNIVKLYDYNILPMPYFEEEICDCSLADQDKPIESEEAALILFNICEGLKFAHVQKIIHRDLKPQNVLLKNGVLKISDWGLSRIISASTTTTATSFTPNYAAPEQINNRAKDERTDIWQLGVILYELVTGKLPFQGDSMTEIGMGIVTKDPMPPGEIKPEAKVIDAVVMKCLQKDPAKRYQSVLELQKDLAMYLRENYAELLKTSVSVKDNNRSAYYCGDLVMINLFTGDMKSAYKYLLDLVHYSKGDVKVESQKLAEQLKYLIDHGIDEISDEFIQKAEIIVHQVSLGFRKRG